MKAAATCAVQEMVSIPRALIISRTGNRQYLNSEQINRLSCEVDYYYLVSVAKTHNLFEASKGLLFFYKANH